MRLKSLDSLRGVAAFIVVLYHSLLMIPGLGEDRARLAANGTHDPMAWLYLTPLRILVSGPTAVLVFFVLSGLVLSMAFVHRDGEDYPRFIVKRFTRIWLPFALVILVAAALTHIIWLGPVEGVTPFFNTSLSHRASAPGLARHLLMFGTVTDLDDPISSLIVEMRISLVFPLLVLLTVWNWRVALVGSLLLVPICAMATTALHLHGILGSVVTSCDYVWLFVLGITISIHLHELRRWVASSSTPRMTALWVVALIGICIAPGRTDEVDHLSDVPLLLSNGLASALIVLLCASEGRALQGLTSRVPAYLGRISYSLYLVHIVVIDSTVRTLHGIAPAPALVVLGIVLAVGVADLMQRFVEVPTTELGRSLARWIGSSAPAILRADRV